MMSAGNNNTPTMKHLTKDVLFNYWNYYLSLEDDIAGTSKYVEPRGQETVYSIEFAKILVLASIEVESVLKQLAFEIKGSEVSGIKNYINVILNEWPDLPTASVYISRTDKTVKPFDGLSLTSDKLDWWNSYGEIKHGRGYTFEKANYSNAIMALSALYILIFYLAEKCNIEFDSFASHYISSSYTPQVFTCKAPENLPGINK